MSIVQFNNDGSMIDAILELEGHRVRLISTTTIVGIESLILTGFKELNENNKSVMSDFSGHRYLYHEEEKGLVFVLTDESDDKWEEQPFVPPEPTPEPPEPTLEEVKAQKVTEMENTMSANITNGVTVTLSDGTTGTFGLSTLNQTSLTNLRLMAEQTIDQDTPSIPWHVSDESANCVYYPPKDIITITDAAIAFVTYNITFFRDLRIYINDLTTKEEVEAIIYDISVLPLEYWSDVLKDIVAQMASA